MGEWKSLTTGRIARLTTSRKEGVYGPPLINLIMEVYNIYIMNLSLLLTDEEYQVKHEGHHPVPYLYEISGDDKTLFYFGVNHSRNPDDKQWQELTEYWERFLSVAGKERVVLLESQPFKISELSGEKLIRQFGERGFMIQLAQASNVPIAWPDITITNEADLLSKQFDPELVYYYIFARSAGALLRTGTMGDFDTVIIKAIETTVRRVPGAPSEVTAYATIHERVFGRSFNPREQETIIRAAAPIYHDSVINDIARVSSRMRNEQIVKEAERYWLLGNSVFMLFGAGHAVVQESALRTLVD